MKILPVNNRYTALFFAKAIRHAGAAKLCAIHLPRGDAYDDSEQQAGCIIDHADNGYLQLLRFGASVFKIPCISNQAAISAIAVLTALICHLLIKVTAGSLEVKPAYHIKYFSDLAITAILASILSLIIFYTIGKRKPGTTLMLLKIIS